MSPAASLPVPFLQLLLLRLTHLRRRKRPAAPLVSIEAARDIEANGIHSPHYWRAHGLAN